VLGVVALLTLALLRVLMALSEQWKSSWRVVMPVDALSAKRAA
jgi:hypothetical protein